MSTSGTQQDGTRPTGAIPIPKRSFSLRRLANSLQTDSRANVMASISSSSRDDVFDELDEVDEFPGFHSPSESPPPTARTINVMVSPSEPLFFNCADPCDGGEQIAFLQTISKEKPVSDVWPECSPEEICYENDENDDIFNSSDYYAADDLVSDATSSNPSTATPGNHHRASVRSRRTRHVSEHSIPRLRRMTSSLLTTPAQRKSVRLSVAADDACAEDIPTAGEVRKEAEELITPAASSTILSPVSRTKSAAHAKLQRAMSKSAEFQTGWKRFKGVLLALAAGFVFTFSAIAQKYLLTSMTFAQIGLIRFLLLIFFMSPSFLIRRMNPFSMALIKQYGSMLLLRGIIGGLCFQLRTYAFAKLPIGDATVIMFSSPIFVGLIAKLVLNEKYQKIYFVTTVAALVGCVLISRPKLIFDPYYSAPLPASANMSAIAMNENVEEESDGRLVGSIVALLSALLAACTFVVLRKLRRVDAVIVVFYFGFVGSLISLVLTFATAPHALPMPTTLMEYWWIFVLAGSSNLGQWLFTRSLHYENANLVSLMRTVDIVWAFAAQMLLFNELPHYLSILGTTIVTLSVTFLGLRKLAESLGDDDNAFMQNRLCMIFCLPRPQQQQQQQQKQRKHSVRVRSATPTRASASATIAAAAAATAASATSTLFARSISRSSKTVTFPDDNNNNVTQQTTLWSNSSSTMLKSLPKSAETTFLTNDDKNINEVLVESDEGIAMNELLTPEGQPPQPHAHDVHANVTVVWKNEGVVEKNV